MGFINNIGNGVLDILRSSAEASAPIVVNKGGDITDVIPGDINIIELTISSQDGQRKETLIGVCKAIDIFESINAPGIFCELAISDSRRIYQDFPILMEEIITITFETPSNPGNPTSYVFHLNSVDNMVPNENQRTMTCTLQCVSPELWTNAGAFVDKDYDDNVSDIVKDIMEEKIKSKKKLHVDKTIGIDKYSLFLAQPFRAIHSLLEYAISDRYKSHTYTFFENRDGFHFTTYERLIEKGRKELARGSSDKQFFYDSVRKERIEDVNIRNIIAYNKAASASALEKRSAGAYVGTGTTVNMQTAGQRQATYTANIGNDEFQKMDENGAASNSTNNVRLGAKTKRPTAYNLLPIFSNRSKTPLAEAFATRQAFIQHLTQSVTQIHIYGDSELTVGDMIKCTLPSASSFDDATGKSRLDSGNYLITRLRHIILITDRPQHTISLELVKNDLSETA
jgi:hypothetical protein